MAALPPGSPAPPLPGFDFAAGPTVLFFYKVTCPVCQLAAPAVQRFDISYPGRIRGVGQDPPDELASFAGRHDVTFPSIPDRPPYELSDAYGIRVVPTTFLVAQDGTILESVESWDRDGLNQVSRRLAALLSREFVPVSEDGDGRPPFRPG